MSVMFMIYCSVIDEVPSSTNLAFDIELVFREQAHGDKEQERYDDCSNR